MWLNRAYREQQWSICDRMDQLDLMLNAVRFPSTTTRRPRSITKFKKYKGSELRSLLLFGYSIFADFLAARYYAHFLLLVHIMHTSESRSIDNVSLTNLRHLCMEYVLMFPRLYGTRHNVQVVHSIVHIGDTVEAYGPLNSYSTFNFESLLGRSELCDHRSAINPHTTRICSILIGLVTRTCNSTRNHSIEIINTITQLRDLCQFINTIKIRPELRALLSTWVLRRPSHSRRDTRLLHQLKNRSVPAISSLWAGRKISYYSTIYIGHVRVTTVDFAHGKRTDDSSVIVSINGIEHFAVVQEIFSVDEQYSFLQVRCLSNSRPFVCSTKQSRFALQSIQQGSIGNECLVPSSNFVEKCVRIDHRTTLSVTFLRFPDLYDTS